jgi:hypothetical protein
MNSANRVSAIILTVILVAFGLLLVPLANAQSAPKPSVPEFTVQIADDNLIEVTIKNQPFTRPQPYINTSLFYNVQVKDEYTDNWNDVYSSHTFSCYSPGWNNNNTVTWYDYPIQSNSDYTILSFPVTFPVGDTIDFRVQAVIANVTEVMIPQFLPDYGLRYHGPDEYIVKPAWSTLYPSDWSNTQTISIHTGATSISASNPTALPTQTITPTYATTVPPTNSYQPKALDSIPLTTFLLVIAVFIAIIAVLLALLLSRHRQTANLRN